MGRDVGAGKESGSHVLTDREMLLGLSWAYCLGICNGYIGED